MTLPITKFNLCANTLAKILYMPPTKEMGLKFNRRRGFSTFGMRVMKVMLTPFTSLPLRGKSVIINDYEVICNEDLIIASQY